MSRTGPQTAEKVADLPAAEQRPDDAPASSVSFWFLDVTVLPLSDVFPELDGAVEIQVSVEPSALITALTPAGLDFFEPVIFGTFLVVMLPFHGVLIAVMLLSDTMFVDSLQPPSVWPVIDSVARPAEAGFFTTFAVNVDFVHLALNAFVVPIFRLTL